MWRCRIWPGTWARATTKARGCSLPIWSPTRSFFPSADGWPELFGRKRFFLTCIFLFTVSSLLCGIAPSLPLLIVFRVIQGVGGGGLQPMAQAILADTFPPQKRGMAFALYGITAIMAPTIGPTLGGWITDNYSWRWIFYINLPVGILTLFLVLRMVEDPPYLEAQPKAAGVRVDYIGIALLALGVGALQVLLDKGQEDDWFGSHFIVTLVVVSAVCLVSLVIWEWRQEGARSSTCACSRASISRWRT